MGSNWYGKVIAGGLMLLLFASCGAGEELDIDQRAQVFTGGALSNFGGVDSDVATARSTASDLMVAREFDFMPAGDVVAAGDASTAVAGASLRFENGTGEITVVGDLVTVELAVISLDEDVSAPQLTGTFSLSAAQAAVEDAGDSFTVSWTIEFNEGGTTYSLDADQVLSGDEWIEV